MFEKNVSGPQSNAGKEYRVIRSRNGFGKSRPSLVSNFSDPCCVVGGKDLPVAPVAFVEVEVLLSWARAS